MINFEKCLAKGLIRKTISSKEQALASIAKAKIFLNEAVGDLEDERFNSATVVAYMAILNCERAILFKDGYRERSHICTTRYLEAKYKDRISREIIILLDHYRETRHEVQYEPDFSAEAEGARQIVDFAGKFLILAEKIINSMR